MEKEHIFLVSLYCRAFPTNYNGIFVDSSWIMWSLIMRHLYGILFDQVEALNRFFFQKVSLLDDVCRKLHPSNDSIMHSEIQHRPICFDVN